jgi:hypothetical protein
MRNTFLLGYLIIRNAVFVVKGWIPGLGMRERKVLFVDKAVRTTVGERLLTHIKASRQPDATGFAKLIRENEGLYTAWKITVISGPSMKNYGRSIAAAERQIREELKPLY